MPAQESDPPVGAGPDNPSGRMPENVKRKKHKGDPAGRPQAANTKLGPPLAPAGPPPHRGGRFPPNGRKKEGPWGPFSCKGPQTPKYA